MLERAEFVVAHDGFFPEHFAERDTFSEDQNERTKAMVLEQVDQHLTLIEDLFELRAEPERQSRVRRLREIFTATSERRRAAA